MKPQFLASAVFLLALAPLCYAPLPLVSGDVPTADIRDCTVTLGSLLGVWLGSISPQANFIGAAGCGAPGTLWFWSFVWRRPPAPLFKECFQP